MTITHSKVVRPPRADPVVCAPVTVHQIEALKSARDNRGSLVAVPPRLTRAVASLVSADLLRVDVVGFQLTPAGALLLARVEENESDDASA